MRTLRISHKHPPAKTRAMYLTVNHPVGSRQRSKQMALGNRAGQPCSNVRQIVRINVLLSTNLLLNSLRLPDTDPPENPEADETRRHLSAWIDFSGRGLWRTSSCAGQQESMNLNRICCCSQSIPPPCSSWPSAALDMLAKLWRAVEQDLHGVGAARCLLRLT